jgi:PAS domain S-box-containing protein
MRATLIDAPPRGAPDSRRRDRAVAAIGALLAAIIFAIDLTQPPGVATGMLYVIVILLGLWSNGGRYAWWAAGAGALLIFADLAVGWYVAGWYVEPPQAAIVNRLLMVLVFALTAALVSRARQFERRSAEQFRQLSDLKMALDAAAIVATTDVTGRITDVNDKFCAISKYSRDELIGQDHRVVNSRFHPPEFIRDLWQTIARGHVWHGEIRNRAKDGSIYWVDTTIVPFLDDRGKPYQYIAIRSEITERKAAEERLREQAALARVGQMAAIVAHEVKNPLAGIKGAVQVISGRRPAGDPEVPIFQDIVARIDSLNGLIQDLLLYARPRQPQLSKVALSSVLEPAVRLLREDPNGRGVDLQVHATDALIEADVDLLLAAVLNLLINAAQAMQGRGRIALSTEITADAVRIAVQDSGPGIPADLRERIFEPFFTTKHRGGGLGLPIARRTVELHGGRLELECPPGGGTLVALTLPRNVRA